MAGGPQQRGARSEERGILAQQELDFGDAARLEAHLVRCGFSSVQAGLAALVLGAGTPTRVGGEMRNVLSLAGREAGERLGCTRQAVAKAAAVLQRHEWFAIVRHAARTTYVLDGPAARSLATLADVLADGVEALADGREGFNAVRELLAAGEMIEDGGAAERPPPREPGATTCNRVQPGATGCNRVQPPSRVYDPNPRQSPSLPCSAPSPWRAAARLPAVAPGCTPSQGGPAAGCEGEGGGGDGLRRLPAQIPFPWKRGEGVNDEELRAAVRERNGELLAWMHDVAVGIRFIEGRPSAEQSLADGSWFRFLVCAHHTATTRGIPAGKRMACLVVRGQDQFDVARTGQPSDQWAGAMLAARHRDPALVALGRMMETEED